MSPIEDGGHAFYVSPTGDDSGPGTQERPFRALDRARDAVRAAVLGANAPIRVRLRGGTYYLAETLALSPEDSGTAQAPVVYEAYPGERPILSGGVRLDLRWEPFRDGIWRADVLGGMAGGFSFSQLFVNGERQSLARFPNYDPHTLPFGGTDDSATSPERVKRWADPTCGFVHGLQSYGWGSLHYAITGVDPEGKLELQGGDQVNRDCILGSRFVEGIFEELDAPGEWYLDRRLGVLYFMPPAGLDLATARVEAERLKTVVAVQGSEERPVRHVRLERLTLAHAARTCLDPYEPLLRGDWSIVRAGALFMEGAEDCSVLGCTFDAVGGNGVFLSGYHRRVCVEGCRFTAAGESAICLVGDRGAVRCPSTWQQQIGDPEDKAPGPATPNYPADCRIHNNLIHGIGVIGKQVAGVFLSMSEGITVSHNTIWHVPRAGICINDGTWGGHVIEHNDVFDTVRETGDHGPFNSWGRDRHWSAPDGFKKQFCRLDSFKTTVIRNNRFAHSGSHSWGIDLDDGSSNYHLYQNLTLGCSFKLREGFFRTVENNVCIGPFPPGKHCCYAGNEDVVRRNIIVRTAGDAAWEMIHAQPQQAREIDYNLYFCPDSDPVFRLEGKTAPPFKTALSLAEWQAAGLDTHSLAADPRFVDPVGGDYRVQPDSPALKLGFRNFEMDRFGVLDPDLRAEAMEGHRRHDRTGRRLGLEGFLRAGSEPEKA